MVGDRSEQLKLLTQNIVHLEELNQQLECQYLRFTDDMSMTTYGYPLPPHLAREEDDEQHQFKSASSTTTTTGAANKANNYAKLITTSIDSVLLNKNVNLVFVCCQPNLHSQISTKALGEYYNIISTYGNLLNSYTDLFRYQ